MNALLRVFIYVFASIALINPAFSQVKDNFVRDTALSNKLRTYLINHIDIYTIDSMGQKKPLSSRFIQEEYGQTYITVRNLKTDSIITDKNLIGVYAFRFADISSSPHLFIKYMDDIEFIDLDSEDFDLEDLLQKIYKLFNESPHLFSLQEEVKTLQGVMETIYNNKFTESSW